MDRGAARSRKRAQQLEKAAQKPRTEDQKAGLSDRNAPSEAGPSRKPRGSLAKPPKPAREAQSRDPELYKPKAIRSATALIWPCEIPPVSLEGITRVDLTNSGVRDVSWLKGTGVRWLSLSGCTIDNWEPVGTLAELTVLNVNECALESLPRCFGKLSKLKAFVGMNNPWTRLDEGVISKWTELNSLIIPHSPNLVAVPPLNALIHLTKLTFSHCPRLVSKSLPDLSSLPLLKDVKMNNLPLLTSLPLHLLAWGTGPMSQLDHGDTRRGLGLESLDVGSCSLDKSALALIQSAKMPNLRSITLHHNPLSTEVSDYPDALGHNTSTPKLQIVDNKRIVERRVPEVKEKKKKKQGKGKERGTRANDMQGKGTRQWGKGKDEGDEASDGPGERPGEAHAGGSQAASGKKRKRATDGPESAGRTGEGKEKKQKGGQPKHASEGKTLRREEEHTNKAREAIHPPGQTAASRAVPNTPVPATTQQSAQATKTADPSALTSANAKRHSKNETGVFGVVDVVSNKGGKKSKGKKAKDQSRSADQADGVADAGSAHGGIDLKAVLTKSDDNGLGVGGW